MHAHEHAHEHARDQRFLHIGAPGQRPAVPVGLWLLRAGDGDEALVGRQAGGQLLLVFRSVTP